MFNTAEKLHYESTEKYPPVRVSKQANHIVLLD